MHLCLNGAGLFYMEDRQLYMPLLFPLHYTAARANETQLQCRREELPDLQTLPPGFKFRIILFLVWLPTKARMHSLLLFLP